MEGPTPVSALIHSATMVGIGFLLLLKLSIFYQNTNYSLIVIVFLGAFTSLLTSLGGVCCYDAKSINANSTSSQLSFMLLAYGSGNFSASYFHFVTHAFYKALLFLVSGLLIQQWQNLQDLRLINPFLKLQLPTVTSGLIIGTSSLTGLPSSLGSYSKEYIFEINYSEAFSFNFGNWLFTLFGAVFSILYVTLLFTTYSDSRHFTSSKKNNIKLLKGEPFGLTAPVYGLILFNLTSSETLNTLFNVTNLFDNYLMLGNTETLNVDYLFNSWSIKILPSCAILIVYLLVWVRLRFSLSIKQRNYNIVNRNKFGSGLFIDKLYNTLVIKLFW